MRFRSTFVEPNGSGLETAVLEAEDERALLAALRGSGRVLVRARRLRWSELAESLRPAPRLTERRRLELLRALRALLDGGVALVAALDAIRSEERDPGTRRLVEALAREVSGGQPLSAALERQRRAFPAPCAELVRAGEASGSLEDALAHLIEHLEWTADVRGTVRRALTYPLLVGSAAYALLLFLLAFTVPRLGDLLARIQADLPPATRALLSTSSVVSEHVVAIVLSSLGGLALAALALRTRRAAELGAAALAAFPPTRPIAMAIARALGCRTIAVLLRAGLPLVAALRSASRATLLPRFSRALARSAERVAGGEPVPRALGEERALPALSLVLLRAGHDAGSLDGAFDQLGREFDGDARRKVARALVLLEPAATVAMAGAVVSIGVLAIRTVYGALEGLGP
jgi:general secretion pathway protein F